MSGTLAKLAGFIWTTLKMLLLILFYAPLVLLLLDLHLGSGLLLLATAALYALAPPARPPMRSTLKALTLVLLLGPLLLLYLTSRTVNARTWS
jgi:hypothetical protein